MLLQATQLPQSPRRGTDPACTRFPFIAKSIPLRHAKTSAVRANVEANPSRQAHAGNPSLPEDWRKACIAVPLAIVMSSCTGVALAGEVKTTTEYILDYAVPRAEEKLSAIADPEEKAALQKELSDIEEEASRVEEQSETNPGAAEGAAEGLQAQMDSLLSAMGVKK